MKTKTNSVFKVTIPKIVFPGFYNTVYDPDEFLDDYSGEEDNYLEVVELFEERIVDNIINHYKKTMPNVFKIKNYTLVSPKEYNYQNDRIDLEIECAFEDILYYFFNYPQEDLVYCLELEEYHSDYYHEALLEVLLSFWPFNYPNEHLDNQSLIDSFLYD